MAATAMDATNAPRGRIRPGPGDRGGSRRASVRRPVAKAEATRTSRRSGSRVKRAHRARGGRHRRRPDEDTQRLGDPAAAEGQSGRISHPGGARCRRRRQAAGPRATLRAGARPAFTGAGGVRPSSWTCAGRPGPTRGREPGRPRWPAVDRCAGTSPGATHRGGLPRGPWRERRGLRERMLPSRGAPKRRRGRDTAAGRPAQALGEAAAGVWTALFAGAAASRRPCPGSS